MTPRPLFATAPKGVSGLLLDELRALGAGELREQPAGVAFTGDLELAYRACLWSRVAARVLLPLAEFPAADAEALYAGVQGIDWSEHLAADGTLAVDFTSSRSAIDHSHFGALKVKDAIVDQLRERCGSRPSVDLERPDLRVNLYLHRDHATLGLDLSGDSLHRRGYRERGVAAPLKENLAAALLLRARWPEIAAAGGALVDPMCGSGTLPIEAALIAADIAPGLHRDRWGFLGWRGHDPVLWQGLLDEARERRSAGLPRLPPIYAFEADRRALHAALANLDRAGLADHVHVERRDLDRAVAPAKALPGLLICNPPYGERLGSSEGLVPLYADLGRLLKQHYGGWHAAVFTGNPELGKRMGLRARRMNKLFNGPLPCTLLHFEVEERWFVDESAPRLPPPLARALRSGEPLTPGGEMFANRLRKNLKQLSRWLRDEGVSCYRLYDADMPEYALAVDVYREQGQEGEAGDDAGNGRLRLHVQEYAPPAKVSAERAEARLLEAMTALPRVLEVAPGQVYFKVRRRQKGRDQYERIDQGGRFFEVAEGGCRLLVNLGDYLDTGLFLDHRPIRLLLGRLAQGRHFLNLFAYTGAASVHAARGGALTTTSVDLSNTYLGWARRNLALNGCDEARHRTLRADCLEWLWQQAREPERRYGLIFLDPPTFSASKKMAASFDVQRDHPELIRHAMALLEPQGLLIFSNNLRDFRMDEGVREGFAVEEITRQTIPPDFARDPRIHNCWRIRRRDG